MAYGPGEISRYWRIWEKPLGRVLFAGEHTEVLYPGTLEGALRSGQRAAEQASLLAEGKPLEAPKAKLAESKPAEQKGGFFSRLFN